MRRWERDKLTSQKSGSLLNDFLLYWRELERQPETGAKLQLLWLGLGLWLLVLLVLVGH
jgi:hypothetical protein